VKIRLLEVVVIRIAEPREIGRPAHRGDQEVIYRKGRNGRKEVGDL